VKNAIDTGKIWNTSCRGEEVARAGEVCGTHIRHISILEVSSF
jgi:hypothetical protein